MKHTVRQCLIQWRTLSKSRTLFKELHKHFINLITEYHLTLNTHGLAISTTICSKRTVLAQVTQLAKLFVCFLLSFKRRINRRQTDENLPGASILFWLLVANLNVQINISPPLNDHAVSHSYGAMFLLLLILRAWIDSVIWPPKVWSVYMQQVFSITTYIKTLTI